MNRLILSLGLLLVFASSAVAAPNPAYGKIELIRDTWGVPHVFADTDAGAMYGLGFASAEDRAFQMHYQLRLIQGRSAEVLGNRKQVRRNETTIDHDRKMRTFGFYRHATAMVDRLDPDTRSLLQAYSEGVNDYVESHRDKLHPLFKELDLKPEPWTPADCIASWWHLAQFFATDGTRELLAWRNAQNPQPAGRGGLPGGLVPPKQTDRWFDDDAAVVNQNNVDDAWLERVNHYAGEHGIADHLQPPKAVGPPGPKFSHAWVVGGEKSTTGSAVLVSDPQTPVRYPSIWYEFHIRGKTIDARGVGVPGCPTLLIGWNANVAWGATALGADQADLYRLKTDKDHPDQYQFAGAWKPMDVRMETIKVRLGESVELKVRQTHFGPVITEFAFAGPNDPPVAMKRVPMASPVDTTFAAAFGMMRARGAGSLAEASEKWQFPSLNLVFGDALGQIGFRVLAAVPLRSASDEDRGRHCYDGATGDFDWKGYVPGGLLPQLHNPRDGWIASGNHRPVGQFYPLPLGLSTGSMGHTVRSWRLYELLAAKEKFTPQDVLAVHYDTTNAARRDIVKLAVHLHTTAKESLSEDAVDALRILQPWLARGAKSDFNEPGAALAGEISTFFRFVNTPLAGVYGGGESGICRFLRDTHAQIAKDAKHKLSPDAATFIDTALAGAIRSARDRYGDDAAQWEAVARRQVQSQRLGAFDTLDGFGPLTAAGQMSVPNLDDVDGGTIRSQQAQSFTQFVPLHDVDQAMSMLPPGHSELPDSRRRTATMKLWEEGKLHPAPLSRAAVEKIAAERKILSRLP